MPHFTLRQSNIIAKISQVCYKPDEGFREDNTGYVAEASMSAESDTKLANGLATLEYDGNEFPIMVSVLEVDSPPDDEDEEDEFRNAVCEIEIGYAEGLAKLAHALGLL